MSAGIDGNAPLAAVALEGELGIFSAAAVRQRLLQALDAAAEVEVNLGKVAEADSAGLQLLIAARKEAAARGKRLRFAEPSAAVRDLLALCGLEALLGTEDGGAA